MTEPELYSLDRRRCRTCIEDYLTATEIIDQPGSQGKLRHGWVLDEYSVAWPDDQTSIKQCVHCRLPGLYPPEAGRWELHQQKPIQSIRNAHGRVTIT